MFDIGWTEMMVLAIVAVVIVGPKDLPKVIRTVGKWMGKARSMAREFQSSLDDIAKEAELDELKQQIDKAGNEFEKAANETMDQADFGKELEHTVDPSGTLLVQTQGMPGYVNKVRYVFRRPGTYRVICLEFCGVAHHDMNDSFEVVAAAN